MVEKCYGLAIQGVQRGGGEEGEGVTTLILGHQTMVAPFGILDHGKYDRPVLALNSLASWSFIHVFIYSVDAPGGSIVCWTLSRVLGMQSQ